MTDAGVQSAMQFEPPGPGPWAQDAVHFPRPVTRYWTETHPEAFVRGTNDFARYYGLLIDGLQRRVRQRLRVQPADARRPTRRSPSASQRAEEVVAGKLWREQLREWDESSKPDGDREAPRDPGRRSRRALRRRARRLPPPVPRPPRGDDHAAHALHRRRDDPDRRLPRARRRMDRPVARRVARPAARRGAGVGGRVRRARAAEDDRGRRRRR